MTHEATPTEPNRETLIAQFEADPTLVAVVFNTMNCARCSVQSCLEADRITDKDLADDGYASREEWRADMDDTTEEESMQVTLETDEFVPEGAVLKCGGKLMTKSCDAELGMLVFNSMPTAAK